MSLNLAKTSLNHVSAIFKKIEWDTNSRNFDIGGGKYNKTTDYLMEKGVVNIVYDKWARSIEDNFKALYYVKHYPPDTATLSNVLCVVKDKSDRIELLELAHRHLCDNGRIYISIYAGDGSGVGKLTKSNTWQNNRPLRTYLEEIKEVFPDATIEKGYIFATKGE